MNKVILSGNLTRDPELTETSAGVQICRFGLAVNRPYKMPDGEVKTDFFNIITWRGTAENVARYCKKGNKIAIVGSLEIKSYEDRDGVKRTSVDIVAQDVEFLTQRAREDGESSNDTPQRNRSGKPQLQSFDDDSDIPF